jgi:hypothetical protein
MDATPETTSPEATLLSTPPETAPPTTTTTTSEEKPWIGQDGNFSDGWLDRLPPDLADAKPTLGKYRSLAELSKAHYSLQQTLGKKATAIQPLSEKSTPEEVANYRKVMGIPETPDGYKLNEMQLPEGMEFPDSFKEFSNIAHKHHASPAMMKELSAHMVVIEQQKMEAAIGMAHERLQKGVADLKEEWKGNYDANINQATRAAKTVGLDINSPGLADPNVVKALSRMAAMLSEDKLVQGNFSATANPGKARSESIMKGNDPATAHLHARYVEGDTEVVKMVRDGLQHG